MLCTEIVSRIIPPVALNEIEFENIRVDSIILNAIVPHTKTLIIHITAFTIFRICSWTDIFSS